MQISSMKNLIISFIILSFTTTIGLADVCVFPQSWSGRWFHQGFPEPLYIGPNSISGKGSCIHMAKNMFIMEESDPSFGKCQKCMVIYEKHTNVLQYKESYCEENVESMEGLCNTIPGDAQLYSMFRKDGDLVKCPFKGPFSFSYSKGDSGQVCDYPASFMDTCSDSKRLKLRYQACLDVEGSEIATEEMSCLATWKEGSSRYLVAMMNHSHVYTDEARYRCFVYQKQPGDDATYKMAQSSFASCLGLWNVNEGYRTFTMKKIDDGEEKCSYPDWMSRHHDWVSVDGHTTLHINKRGHSVKITNHTGALGHLESHATCQNVEMSSHHTSRIVAHIKADCDSGYVCLMFLNRDDHVIELRYGQKSHDPNEACMSYYFDHQHSPVMTLVPATGHNTKPCPFSGRYSITGPTSSLASLLDPTGEAGLDLRSLALCSSHTNANQRSLSETVMHAGCSDSADLQVETECGGGRFKDHFVESFTCHGKWRQDGSDQHILVLSLSSSLSMKREYFMLCLSPTAQDGVLRAATGKFSGQCESGHFNITSSGPCLQALTAGSSSSSSASASAAAASTAAHLTNVALMTGAFVLLLRHLRRPDGL